MNIRMEIFIKAAILTLLLAIAVFIVINYYNYSHTGRRPSTEFDSCKRNLNNLSIYCEIYAADNNGYYPKDLDILVRQGYMKELPRCLASYKPGYMESLYVFCFRQRHYSEPKMTYINKSYNDKGMIIHCSGHHHREIIGEKDGPAYGTESNTVDTLEKAKCIKE